LVYFWEIPFSGRGLFGCWVFSFFGEALVGYTYIQTPPTGRWYPSVLPSTIYPPIKNYMSTCYASVPTKKPPLHFCILAAANETSSAGLLPSKETFGAPRPPLATTD
jgi:hypothetical protein